jgi:predicted DNA-binding transcriptional regulator AlpA
MQAKITVHADVLLPTEAVRDRYKIVDRTIARWLADPKLNFPKPVKFRHRKFWHQAELEAWERSFRHIKRNGGEAA